MQYAYNQSVSHSQSLQCVVKGQQVGFNSKTKRLLNFYLKFIGGIVLIFWVAIAFEKAVQSKLIEYVIDLLFIFLLLGFIVRLTKVNDQKKQKEKIYFFDDYLMTGNKVEIPFNIFEYATVTKSKICFVTVGRTKEFSFRLIKGIDSRQFIEQMNQKINTSRKKGHKEIVISNEVKEVLDKVSIG